MRPLVSVLLLVAAAVPIGAMWQVREKRFDPVRITDARQVPGRYIGIDPDWRRDVLPVLVRRTVLRALA